jgi:hypothetical protein
MLPLLAPLGPLFAADLAATSALSGHHKLLVKADLVRHPG